MSDFPTTAPAPTPVPDHGGRAWSAQVHGEVFARQVVTDREIPRYQDYNVDEETVRLEHHSDVLTNTARLLPEDAMTLADQLNAAAHAIITRRVERADQRAEQQAALSDGVGLSNLAADVRAAAEAQHVVVPD